MKIGIEKEYSFYVSKDNVIASAFVSDLFICELLSSLKQKNRLTENINKLLLKGWQIKPEFSYAIIEVISPIYNKANIAEMLDNLQIIEEFIYLTASKINIYNQNICLTPKLCSGSSLFINSNKIIRSSKNLYLNELLAIRYLNNVQKEFNVIPSELMLVKNFINPLHLFANFTSTNITISDSKLNNYDYMLDFYWDFLFKFYLSAQANNTNNVIFGKENIILSKAVREVLLDWADPIGRYLISNIYESKNQKTKAYEHVFGSKLIRNDAIYKNIYAYAARPRYINNSIVAIEFRCFHSSYDIGKLQEIC